MSSKHRRTYTLELDMILKRVEHMLIGWSRRGLFIGRRIFASCFADPSRVLAHSWLHTVDVSRTREVCSAFLIHECFQIMFSMPSWSCLILVSCGLQHLGDL